MNLLIIGGTAAHRGGVEQFCDRATRALNTIGGFRVRHYYANTAYFRLHSLPGLLKCMAALVRHRPRTAYVWLQYCSLPDLALIVLCRALGYSLLVTPHLGANWASQSRATLRRLTRLMLGLAGGIGLISPTQAQEVSLPENTPRFNLRTFLPQSFGSRPQPGTNKVMKLVHAGRLSEGKGTLLFIEVCAALQRRGVAFEAELVGSADPDTLQRVHAAITKHALANAVQLVGHVEEKEMLARLAAADVLVHLSRIDSFPLIVLESLGSGVYPICKNLAGARLIVETYCGRIVAEESAVEEVVALLSDTPVSQLRAQALAASQCVAQDYGWEPCVAAVSNAFTMMVQPA